MCSQAHCISALSIISLFDDERLVLVGCWTTVKRVISTVTRSDSFDQNKRSHPSEREMSAGSYRSMQGNLFSKIDSIVVDKRGWSMNWVLLLSSYTNQTIILRKDTAGTAKENARLMRNQVKLRDEEQSRRLHIENICYSVSTINWLRHTWLISDRVVHLFLLLQRCDHLSGKVIKTSMIHRGHAANRDQMESVV